jgi:hypothetical protein
MEDFMNQSMRYTATDTLVRQWPAVAPVDASTFVGTMTNDRLKAFKTRFRPSTETIGQKLENVALTAGIYVAAVAASVALSTANLTPILHALHLNVV